MSGYKFKRAFYYEVKRSIKEHKATFILGPRKCGKTICMKQLADEIDNSLYYDVKTMNDDEAIDLIDDIVRDIQDCKDIAYLVDEVTYLYMPEKDIAKIANAYSDNANAKTKIVFAGSQLLSIEAWGYRAFSANAKYIRTDFLSYPEWLAYKGISEVTAETYDQFVVGTREFYNDFTSLEDYLHSCLDETVLSNYKTSNAVFNNECDELNADILLSTLYATLINQKDRPVFINYYDNDRIVRQVRSSMKDAFRSVGNDEVKKRAEDILSSRVSKCLSYSTRAYMQSLNFLYNCGLITLTYISDETRDFSNIINVPNDLRKMGNSVLKSKNELFGRVNICIKYPMFYSEIIKDMLGEHFPDKVSGDLLGGIVECHARGILSDSSIYEYHSDNKEVDYVDFAQRIAIEFTISNKSNSELHFDDLPKDFKRVLLTRDIVNKDNDIERIPYYQFIYDNSAGKELVEHIDNHQFDYDDYEDNQSRGR